MECALCEVGVGEVTMANAEIQCWSCQHDYEVERAVAMYMGDMEDEGMYYHLYQSEGLACPSCGQQPEGMMVECKRGEQDEQTDEVIRRLFTGEQHEI